MTTYVIFFFIEPPLCPFPSLLPSFFFEKNESMLMKTGSFGSSNLYRIMVSIYIYIFDLLLIIREIYSERIFFSIKGIYIYYRFNIIII